MGPEGRQGGPPRQKAVGPSVHHRSHFEVGLALAGVLLSKKVSKGTSCELT